jgi:uncharacterized protein YebE (UPF0316 family)
MAPVEHFPFFGPETFGLSPAIYYWAVLPVMIFCARIMDMSMDTVRIIYVNRGRKYLAPAIGFFQVLIWMAVISAIMQNLTHWINSIAYAGGFATGNFVGMLIEEKLSVGMVAVRVITAGDANAMSEQLRQKRYGVTCLLARGEEGGGRLLFSVIPRKDLTSMLDLIHRLDPLAFVSVQDVRSVREGAFPGDRRAFHPSPGPSPDEK